MGLKAMMKNKTIGRRILPSSGMGWQFQKNEQESIPAKLADVKA
jgi:hypothetical protein